LSRTLSTDEEQPVQVIATLNSWT